jgi:SAM-dependent methyltransferase
MLTYLYDNGGVQSLERLRGLEAIEDVNTISMLESLQHLEGLRCLELGAGAGSIAAWLAGRVGPTGHVLATDIDVSHLVMPGITVLQHDLRSQELPDGAFDLVHLRHVLIHLPEHMLVLDRIRRSMRRGAHLLLEESDLRSWGALGDPFEERHTKFNQGVRAVLQVYAARGMNVSLGDSLAAKLEELAFDVVAERRTNRSVTGAGAEANYQRLSVLHLARGMGETDPEGAKTLEAFACCFDEPALCYRSRTTVSVMARAR